MARAEDAAAPAELPDSPGASYVATPAPMGGGDETPAGMAPKYHRVIQPYEIAQKLSAKDKFLLSIHENLTLSNVGSSLFSAGYSQLLDGRPHFGEDMPAFGERFGASMLKGATQNISRDGIFANIFHEDPHYYVRGRSVPIRHRALYAASRVFVVRKDSGSHGVYYSNIAAICLANSLTNFYYPVRDQGQKETFQSIGMSFITNMGTNELKEFLGDALGLVFHKKR